MSLYSSFEHIKVEIDGGIATVILNRPEILNAVNERLHKELGDIWLTLDADADVEVIILTGAGRAFCAGGDINNMKAWAGDDQKALHNALHIGALGRAIVNNMLEIHKPVVAAVNGAAMGIGSTLALLCDVAVMADDARIGDTHVPAGLVAGDGGTVLWPMLIGPMKAKEYLMTGQFLTGTQAAEMGLVNYACPREELLEKANELAARFLAQPRWAMRWTKMAVNKLIKDQVNLVLDTSMSLEVITLFTNDHKEAARAFIDKRAPKFVGS
jgi:enoyl-CoA hydratase